MCSTPSSEATSTTTSTTSTTIKCSGPLTLTTAAAAATTTDDNVRTSAGKELDQEASGVHSINNNNNSNNNSRSGKTSKTTCAKNKQGAARQSDFLETSLVASATDGQSSSSTSTAFRGAAPVSGGIDCDAPTSGPSALLTTATALAAAGSGRLAAGTRLAPGNQPIFGGGGGGGKGMTATVTGSEPPVYSKTGELIDNYGSNNAIISGSNSATKRKNTKVLATTKRSPAPVQNSNKKKGGKLSHGVQGNLKADADIFLTTPTGGKTISISRSNCH